MVKVHVVRDKTGFIWELKVEGHAEAGEFGKDIVCAAVSVIAQTGLGALEEIAGISKKKFIIKPGFIKFSVPLDISQDKKNTVKIILETAVIGFKQIEFTPEYSRYISVLDEEV